LYVSPCNEGAEGWFLEVLAHTELVILNLKNLQCILKVGFIQILEKYEKPWNSMWKFSRP